MIRMEGLGHVGDSGRGQAPGLTAAEQCRENSDGRKEAGWSRTWELAPGKLGAFPGPGAVGAGRGSACNLAAEPSQAPSVLRSVGFHGAVCTGHCVWLQGTQSRVVTLPSW